MRRDFSVHFVQFLALQTVHNDRVAKYKKVRKKYLTKRGISGIIYRLSKRAARKDTAGV